MTFDNVKSYDAIAQKVTIENTFGLGRTIADVKLDTPLMVSYIFYNILKFYLFF